MFFNDWEPLARIFLVGAITYVALILLLRISGNRTLSKMNSFDLVVTVAFGSTFSSILIDASITLAQGISAIALLIVLQFVITWLSVRSRIVSKLIKTQPTLILTEGTMQAEAMKRTRITADEVRSAIRQRGYGAVEMIDAVILETDGSLSVIARADMGSRSACQNIRGATSVRLKAE